ncbi:MAG: CarD family transcriptional regulator, partial [Actinomycetales bacterium]
EALIPVLVDGMETLVDYLPERASIIELDPERIRSRSVDMVSTAEEFLAASWHNAAAGNEVPIDLSGSTYCSIDEFRDLTHARGLPWIQLSPLTVDLELLADLHDPTPVEVFDLQTTEPAGYAGDLGRALADIRDLLDQSRAVVLVAPGHGVAERFAESLGGEDIPARLVESLPDAPEPRVVTVSTGALRQGFWLTEANLVVLTEADLVGQRSATKDMRRMPSRRRRAIDPLSLKAGDFVVHEHHGVGRYVEMVQRTVSGAVREYLVIEYAASKRGQPPDRLFVPTDQLDLVTRYVGGESPAVHRLGGSDWQKAKGRARKAVKQIADELVRLYAKRQAASGHAFALDTPWQRELEDAFAYVETPDQMACIDEVKSDMERTVPMDRLICG